MNSHNPPSKEAIDNVMSVNHSNWLKQDITGHHIKKLEELKNNILTSATEISTNFSLDSKNEIILSKLIRAKTIQDIINYVKTNQYPT